jgi:hypothetical protein
MLARSGELDRILDGRGLTFERTPDPPPPEPAQSFFIPRPDWDAERLEREQLEREQEQQERDRILAEELAKITDDDQVPETLPRRRGWQRRQTP